MGIPEMIRALLAPSPPNLYTICTHMYFNFPCSQEQLTEDARGFVATRVINSAGMVQHLGNVAATIDFGGLKYVPRW